MSKYNKLPATVKKMLSFNEWLMWTLKADQAKGDYSDMSKYYDSYRNFRLWCVEVILHEKVDYSDIPMVTHKTQSKVFRESRKDLDLGSFMKIETHRFGIMNIGGKISPINQPT